MRFLGDMGVSRRVRNGAAGDDAVHLRDEGLQRLPNGDIFQKGYAEPGDWPWLRCTSSPPPLTLPHEGGGLMIDTLPLVGEGQGGGINVKEAATFTVAVRLG